MRSAISRQATVQPLRYRQPMRRRGATLLVLLALGLAGCQEASGEAFQYDFNQPLVLGEDVTVGQTFRPVTDAVAGVDVLTATFGQGPGGGRLDAVLLDESGGEELARVTLAADEVGDNEWAAIRFSPPVPAPEVAAVELAWRGDGTVAVWANVPQEEPEGQDLLNDPYTGGQLLVDGERSVGDLAFRVVGTGGPADAARNLAGIARQGLAGLARDPLFVLGWLLLLGGSGVLATWGLRPSGGELTDERRDEQRGEHEEARP